MFEFETQSRLSPTRKFGRFLHSPRRTGRGSHRGFALIIVLVLLTLAVVLTVGFLGTVTSERQTAQSAFSGADTQQLANTVVQVVMGQIRQATSGGTTVAWASQPGMIRTYDNNGNPLTHYKLYSSGTMTLSGQLTLSEISDYDPNWAGNTALWTDLNAPEADITGTNIYPILDPAAVQSLNGTTQANGVQGCSVTGAPTSGTTNPVPMPVQWLYRLRDGSLVAATAAGTNRVTVSGASASNPIVARIAFWTDDETCKVNINTAGEGTYWDTPRFYPDSSDPTQLSNPNVLDTPQNLEMQFAYNQPAQFEFQRYPGHPAQVALSPILPALAAITDPATLSNTMAGVTPRIAPGGSIAGTVRPTGPIDLTQSKRYALYDSVDELEFGVNYNGTARQPTTTSTGTQLVSNTDLERCRFFLTANSRAPEVNLFNQPRVSCWPINTDLATNPSSPYTSPYDRLTAFCSALHSSSPPAQQYIYHFQRQKSNDTTNDYANIPRNQQLYAYLQNLTSQNIPGFGGNFQSKYAPLERDQILTEIFDYIRCTDDFDANLGFPSGFQAYGSAWTGTQYQFSPYENTAQADPVYGQITPIQITTSNGKTMGFGRFPTVSEVGFSVICCATPPQNIGQPSSYTPDWLDAAQLASCVSKQGTWPIVPIPLSQGGGMADTSQPQYLAWQNAVKQFLGTTAFSSYYNPAMSGITLTLSTQRVYQMALLFKTFCPEQGLQPINPDYIMRVSGANGTTLDQNVVIQGAVPSNPFPTPPYDTFYCNKVGIGQWAPGGNAGVEGTWGPLYQAGNHDDLWYNRNGRAIYPFLSTPFRLDTAKSNLMDFASAVKLKIEMFQGLYSIDANSNGLASPLNGGPSAPSPSIPSEWLGSPPNPSSNTVESVVDNSSNLVQTLYVTLPIPESGFPLPTLAVTSGSGDGGDTILWEENGSYYNWQAWYLPLRAAFFLQYGAESITFPSPTAGGPPLQYSWSDTAQSVSINHGDVRLVAASPTVDSPGGATVFLPHPQYGDGVHNFADYFRNFEFNMSDHDPAQTGTASTQQKLVPVAYSNGYKPRSPDVPTVPLSAPVSKNLSDPTLASPFEGPAYTMDWDTSMVGEMPDGPYINKADDGDYQAFNAGGFSLPYFNYSIESIANATTFLTPNRLMPSPGVIGSLSTGVIRGLPWQTLLFRPALQANGQLHPNASVPPYADSAGPPYTTPPDHLLMDLFWVPVVEPYAISDQFSTAGKLNMNYQIVPFTYIDRSTPMVCLMKSEKLIAVPNSDSIAYKDFGNSHQYRLPLDTTETGSLRQFKERFAAGDIFRSPSEICDIFLMPQQDALGATQSWSSDSNAVSFWSNNMLTGDNMREKPYSDLYGRLTTKSNTYTVHFRVESLKKVPTTPANEWVDGTDVVTSDKRGSSIIERYLDPNDPTIPDFALPANYGSSLDSYYKYHVLSSKLFSP